MTDQGTFPFYLTVLTSKTRLWEEKSTEKGLKENLALTGKKEDLGNWAKFYLESDFCGSLKA